MKTGIRNIDEPDWAPPGGTSTNRYREIAGPFDAAFLQGLRERVNDLTGQAWMKVYNDGASIYIGWRDGGGGYYVGHGLEHNPSRPEDGQRAFLWLSYSFENEDGEFAQERIGGTWFAAPYARDLELHLDLAMAWFAAHRRTLARTVRHDS